MTHAAEQQRSNAHTQHAHTAVAALTLNGSPTVSPVTAALCASLPLPPKFPISMNCAHGRNSKTYGYYREGDRRQTLFTSRSCYRNNKSRRPPHLLSVVPRAAHVVEEQGHEDTSDRAEH